jgi:cell division septation protein DedD
LGCFGQSELRVQKPAAARRGQRELPPFLSVADFGANQFSRTCQSEYAKNMKLEGGKKAEYLNDCMNTNVAANEARKAGMQEHLIADKSTNHPKEQAVAKQKPAADKQASKRTAKKKTDAKPKVSLKACSKQATQQKLKGKERTHFIHDCRKG